MIAWIDLKWLEISCELGLICETPNLMQESEINLILHQSCLWTCSTLHYCIFWNPFCLTYHMMTPWHHRVPPACKWCNKKIMFNNNSSNFKRLDWNTLDEMKLILKSKKMKRLMELKVSQDGLDVCICLHANHFLEWRSINSAQESTLIAIKLNLQGVSIFFFHKIPLHDHVGLQISNKA